ncbi:MAG TPA: sulfotransferase family 2 domain-containing protein [Casimicrobiaceae bacterium]
MPVDPNSVVGRPAVFLHIQKTAGTSITETVWGYYADSIASHGDFVNRTPESMRQYRFVSGHFGFEFARELIESRYSFTFLRDPIERVLSLYYFCRTRDPKEFAIYETAHQLELPEFLRAARSPGLVHSHICNQQVWQIAWGWGEGTAQKRTRESFADDEMLALARVNLRKFSFVGFAETLEEDYRKVLKDLGIPAPAEAPRSNATGPRPHTESLSGEALELAREITALDQALYDEAWALRRGSSAGRTAESG